MGAKGGGKREREGGRVEGWEGGTESREESYLLHSITPRAMMARARS